MSQQEFPDMPVRLAPVSPSRLDSWLQCPKRYRFEYVDRPKPPGKMWAHQMLGISVHAALKDWFGLAVEKRTAESLVAVLRANWRVEGFRDIEQSDQVLSQAESWLRQYVAKIDVTIEPWRMEVTLGFTTPRLNVSGRIDRIDERGGECVVIDYKTGRSPLGEDDARTSMALAMYVQAVRRSLKKPCTTVELHHIPTGTIARHNHTDESLARQLDRMEQIGIESSEAVAAVVVDPDRADELFPAQPSGLCGWCDFWELCPSGKAAAPRKEPWAGVEVSSSE